MDHMDWYFDTDGDNKLFLKDQEELNESTVSKYCFQFGVDSQSLSSEAEKEVPMLEEEHSSGSIKIEGFLHRNEILDDRPDYHLDSLTRIDHIDDIFFRSLLEKDEPVMEIPYQPVYEFSESECSTPRYDNLLKDVIMNSWSIFEDQSGAQSSKCTNPCASSPSSVWDKMEDTSPFFTPSYSNQMKDCSIVMAKSEQNSICEEDGEENSREESILHELELVMTQLNQNTRICFRDALYRLANSSEQRYSSECQTGGATMNKLSLSPFDNETLRVEKTKLLYSPELP